MSALGAGDDNSRFSVLFRADGGEVIGLGHIMRCLAVAEVLHDWGIACLFAASRLPESARRRLEQAGGAVTAVPGPPGGADDRAATAALAARAGAVVLDGYEFGPDFRAGVAAAGRPVLAFDDGAFAGPSPPGLLAADLVVNAAPGVAAPDYAAASPNARLLLGPTYAPLRRDIRQAASRPPRPMTDRRSVLVTFGGSDPLGLTVPCIARLGGSLPGGVRLVVAVGGANPRLGECRAAAACWPGQVEVHHDTPAMGALMADAGLAVAAAGGTVAELAALAVPSLLAVVAGNQAPAAQVLARAEGGNGGGGIPPWCRVMDARGGTEDAAARLAAAALSLWDALPERAAMAAAARGLVDGRGAERIARALCDVGGWPGRG